MQIGSKRWAIPEGYIPGKSTGEQPEMTSHDSISILNAGEAQANIEITVFFADREPIGPFHCSVAARRSRHIRYNELDDPASIPKATEYSSLVTSDVPVVIQYTRLDSRQAANALLSVMAFPIQE